MAEPRAARAQDLDAVTMTARHDRSAAALRARGIQRAARDHGHATPVARDEVLGELGQKLTGRGLVRPVGAVEEADVHVRYQSIVRRRPSRKSVVA